jgi:hypothetical protein
LLLRSFRQGGRLRDCKLKRLGHARTLTMCDPAGANRL